MCYNTGLSIVNCPHSSVGVCFSGLFAGPGHPKTYARPTLVILTDEQNQAHYFALL
jgi:hypothetical protein